MNIWFFEKKRANLCGNLKMSIGLNKELSLMKIFTITLFFFFVCSSAFGAQTLHYQKTAKRKQTEPKNQADIVDLEALKEDLEEDMRKLLFTLTHEHTSLAEKLEIIEILSETALLNNEIMTALKELVKRGSQCENEPEQTACRTLDILSLKAHGELMRRKTSRLIRIEQESWDHYKDMALDGVLIITGLGLAFIPVGGPFMTTALFTIRAATVGKLTGGSIVTGIGLYRVGREVLEGEDEDLKSVFEFVKGVAAGNILTKAIFHFAQLGDAELLNQIVLISSESELINLLYAVIKDSSHSDETRSVAIQTLLALPEALQIRRTRTVQLLKDIVDTGQDQDLEIRISALKVLGKIAERAEEAAEYLEKVGGKKESEDELRLIALIHAGRNPDYIDIVIDALLELITDSKNKGNKPYFLNSLESQIEIPPAFLSSLLSVKKEQTNHIIVIKEFILTGISDIETKLKLSDILIHWTKASPESEEIKEFLKKIWENPALDIGIYVEQLHEKNSSQDNKPAFDFLKTEISHLRGILDSSIVLLKVDSSIIEFKRFYPDQIKITEELRTFIESYKKMQNYIEN